MVPSKALRRIRLKAAVGVILVTVIFGGPITIVFVVLIGAWAARATQRQRRVWATASARESAAIHTDPPLLSFENTVQPGRDVPQAIGRPEAERDRTLAVSRDP